MPPVQKAGTILGAGIVAGIAHSGLSSINRNTVLKTNTTTIVPTNNVPTTNVPTNNSINKLTDNLESSPLEDLLLDIEILNYTCWGLVIILIIQITFKFFTKNSVKLNLSKYIGTNLNYKLEYYLNKIIALNKNLSTIYI